MVWAAQLRDVAPCSCAYISASLRVSFWEFNCTAICLCVSYVRLCACVCLEDGDVGLGARRSMTSVPSLLRGVLRQSGGKEACGGLGVLEGPCAATVTCRTWHSSRQVAGGRGKHHPLATMGVGAGWTGWQWNWRFFPRLYQKEK